MGQSPNDEARRTAVIGGGIAGLTAAYRLARQGHRVTLWEQDEQLGGLAAAFELPSGAEIEKFYHHLFMSDRAIIELMEELGIGSRLRWIDSNVGFFYDGRIYPLTTATDLIRLPFIPVVDRVRLGLITLYLQRISTSSGGWKRFERVTAWEWLRRTAGQRAFNRVWGAQLRAKFGPRAPEIAMAWFWNKIFLRTQSRPGLLAREQLGYIDGSFNVLIDRLADACRELGVDIRTGTGVEALERHDESASQFTLVGADGRRDDADIVVATIPSPLIMRLIPDMPAAYAQQLTSMIYQGAIVILLQLDRKLSDIYWLNIGDDRLPFTGIIEHTNLLDPADYGGAHLVYVGKYLDWDHPFVTMTDDELRHEVVPKLRLVNPGFDDSWIERMWVFRARAAQPIVTLEYSEKVPSHRSPIAGLYVANMSQIYPEDRGTNYAVDLGNRIAEIIDEDLAAGSA
ncbi:MAG: NAD(P)/FAD-dependent oxidoreductase [Thermomicrobiales bacterium]